MDSSTQEGEGKKKIAEVQTFPVPFSFGEKKEKITIKTNTLSKSSQEQIINQALKFHSQGNISEAAKYYQYCINQDFKDCRVFSNYGIILQTLGKSEKAELSYRKAIELNPDYADAYLNLGILLVELDKLQDAEISLKKVIELKPDRTSYFYYSNCLFWRKEFEAAKKNLYKAHLSFKNDLRYQVLNAAESTVDLAVKTSINESKLDYSKDSKIFNNRRFDKLILNRPVEAELISYLYTLKNRKLGLTKDGRFGEGTCSIDLEFFNDTSPIIKKIVDDISKICKEALQLNKIFFVDSFFNIFVSGSGAKPHAHRARFDRCFDLHLHKYALVYYLDIGDQSGEDPGILKLYEPDEEILPNNGMILIIDSKRYHSVSYRGNKDRIMIGVNFYGL